MKPILVQKMIQLFLWCGLLQFVSLSFMAKANWIFDGTLIIPPVCELSHDNPIGVSFGKVGVRKIDGNSFKKDIPYNLDCKGNLGQAWDVSLMISGIQAANFNKATLEANSPLNNGKLGIEIRKNGVPLELNKPFAIETDSPPTLSAVPVKRSSNGELIADDFTATATLTIAFQ